MLDLVPLSISVISLVDADVLDFCLLDFNISLNASLIM